MRPPLTTTLLRPLILAALAVLDPAVVPLNGLGTRGISVTPLKTKVLRQCLDGVVVSWPHSALSHNFRVQIDSEVGCEYGL